MGLVLTYDLKRTYWGVGAQSYTWTAKYDVIRWVNVNSIVEISQTGDWQSSGTKYVEIPSWDILYSNGTPTGEYMFPLWINVTGLQAGQMDIPQGSSYSRSYNAAYGSISVPAGDFVCWRCGAEWQAFDWSYSRYLYYETTLGVLVGRSDCDRELSDPYGVPDIDQFEERLTDSNIALFISAPPLLGGSTLMVLWLFFSVAVVSVPIIMLARLAQRSLEREPKRGAL